MMIREYNQLIADGTIKGTIRKNEKIKYRNMIIQYKKIFNFGGV